MVNRNIFVLDSVQFLNASIDTLAENLQDNDFNYLSSEFIKYDIKDLKRKDGYPYEWVDSYKKFKYQELPPKEAFFHQ